MGRAVLAAVLALAASSAGAQDYSRYKPTPVDDCFRFGAPRLGPERGSSVTPLLHELVEQLPSARASCEQAVKDRPKEPRLHAFLARLRALAGDDAGALEEARGAAAAGSATAQVLLGAMLAEGRGAPRDYAAARELFRGAAKWGSPHAYFNLGVMAANGWGTEQNDVDAAIAFRQAAAAGDPLAMQILAQRYDKDQAPALLEKAALALLPEGPREPLRLASLGRAAPDGAALLAWYEERARGGEVWAAAYMGALSEAGQWAKQDYAAAAAWYAKAGEAGNVPSQYRMAKFSHEGRGVPKSEAEWRRWGQMSQVQRCDALERSAPGANACDRLAADRYDRDRTADGVDPFCMQRFAERAVAACSAALKGSPATLRYRTQLARALAHAGRFPEARRAALEAARSGSSAAMILLGVMSQRGLGTPKNEADALAWYRKAADAGDPRGVALVSTSAYSGVGVAKGSPEAQQALAAMREHMVATAKVRTLAEQAEGGDVRAQHNLAAQLEREKKYDQAIAWYERAAAQGFGPSAMNLAQMYEKGIGVKPDGAEARKRYRRLALQGNGEALYRAAKLAADAHDYPEALEHYARAIRNDDYRAMLDLGELHEHGRGVPRDVKRAAALYERAAERSKWARAKLGILYLQGDGIPKDYARARGWLRRAADDGNAGARNNLGWMSEKGLGAGVDYAAARELYLAALRGGNPQAKGNLEDFFAAGRGAPSGAGALAWYLSGAEAGIAAAQYRVGHMYANGEGVARDDRRAVEWLLKAAQQGHREAYKEAGEAYYRLGEYGNAAALGHEGAARKYAEQLTQAGRPDAAAEVLRMSAAAPKRLAPPPAWPTGIAADPGEDPARTIMVRSAGVGSMQAAGVDAGMANVYTIIPWIADIDGKQQLKPAP